jgi:hypothetical protein
MAVRKNLIAIALLSLVATNAEAHGGGWNGHYHHGGGSYFWWGAAVGAALTIPFYYSRTWAGPGPYYYSPYYGPGPTVYVNPPLSVQSQPVYVQSQPSYLVAAAQPRNVVTQSPPNGVIELGPVNSLAPANSNSGQAPSDQWFVYPGKGQSEQQQANDRYECNRWAVNASGYDPDLRAHRNPQTGPVAYGRALSACLVGRGYAVR